MVHNEALRLGVPPLLRFVFETLERIDINLLKEKTSMDFLKCEEKPSKKIKVAKASLPSHAANTNATYFKCGKAGHLRKNVRKARLSRLIVEGLALGIRMRCQKAQQSQMLEASSQIEAYGKQMN